MTLTRMLLAAGLAVATAGAAAQPQKIYRCGPDGRQLQQYPCGGVAAQPAVTKPAPSAAERAAAAAVAKREAELAERMQIEREQRERAEAKNAAMAVNVGATPAAPAASAPKSNKKKTPTAKKPS